MRPVITGWSAISAYGIGRVRSAGELRSGTAAPVDGEAGAHVAAEFVVEDVLGKKGTSSMDRSSALAVGTVRELLAEADVPVDEATGVVLGTTSGSTRTQLGFTEESLTRRKPYFVNPATMPFALMNSAAAQVAIWHRLTGPNSTIAGGRMSGVAVLRYARRLLATGRASGLVCGAVEEHGAMRQRLERLRGNDAVLGEGAVAMFLEPPGGGRAPLAELLAVTSRMALDGDRAPVLADCIHAALAEAEVRPGEVAALAVSASDGDRAREETAAVESVFGERLPMLLNPARLIGDTGAATGFFQIAALLSVPAAGPVLLTALEDDGAVGCVLLRRDRAQSGA